MPGIRLRMPGTPPAPGHAAPPRRLITDLGHDHVRFAPVSVTKIRDRWWASVRYMRRPRDHVRFGGFARVIRADERVAGGRCADEGVAAGQRADGGAAVSRRAARGPARS